MFEGCSSLENLNISNLNTSKVTRMDYMFSGCSSLSNLKISNFTFDSVTNDSGMFQNIPKAALITVKDQSAKDYILGIRSDLTNIQIATEV